MTDTSKNEVKLAHYVKRKFWDLLWAGGELLPIKLNRKKYDVEYHRGNKLVLTRTLGDTEIIQEYKVFFTVTHVKTHIHINESKDD